METLCQKLLFPPDEQKAFKTAVTGAWNLLRASSSMKDQSILGTARNFGLFFQNMKEESNCFEKPDVKKQGAEKQVVLRKALLKMFSPGLNRKIAEGLLDNLSCCSAICDALDKDSSTAIISATVSGGKDRLSLVDAIKASLESDAEKREAKRLLSADFNSHGWMVKKAIAVIFSVNLESVAQSVLDRVKESFEACQGDADDDSSEKESGPLTAIMTVVTVCSKDLPAILRRLTVEYFSNREKTFQTRRNVDECQEAGIPFNPAQLAEPGAYLDLVKTILNPLQIKYSALHLHRVCALSICRVLHSLLQSKSLWKKRTKNLVRRILGWQ